MPKGYSRTQRIGHVIQTALADILLREVKDTRFNMATITHVDVAPDLKNARVYVSVWDDEKTAETVEALNHATKYLRYTLAHTIELRVIPELKFIFDDSTVRGNRISSLLNSALKKDKND